MVAGVCAEHMSVFRLAPITILVDGSGVPHQLAQPVAISPAMFQLMRRVVFVNPASDRPAR